MNTRIKTNLEMCQCDTDNPVPRDIVLEKILPEIINAYALILTKSKLQAPGLDCITENYFSYFSTKTYVVGTKKNRLNETVLLSTQNTCLN